MFLACVNNQQMKRMIRNGIYELYIFLSTPLAVHRSILHLSIKFIKNALKESKYFK